MMAAQTIPELAGEAYDWFETATRPDGDEFYRLKDGAPEWLSELVREAHGELLPDDWRYRTIREALGAIHDAGEGVDLNDLEREFADGVDVYTGDLIAWLASHGSRASYCDDAENEGLVADDASLVGRIALGQYMERGEVFGSVVGSLGEIEGGE